MELAPTADLHARSLAEASLSLVLDGDVIQLRQEKYVQTLLRRVDVGLVRLAIEDQRVHRLAGDRLEAHLQPAAGDGDPTLGVDLDFVRFAIDRRDVSHAGSDPQEERAAQIEAVDSDLGGSNAKHTGRKLKGRPAAVTPLIDSCAPNGRPISSCWCLARRAARSARPVG